MGKRDKSFAIINIARTQLGIEDDDYRALLTNTVGKDSLRAMTPGERDKVIDALKARGFKKNGSNKTRASSKPYVRLIWALWRSCAQKGVVDDGSKSALRSFVTKRTGKTDPEFLTYGEATPVIEALKAMEARG